MLYLKQFKIFLFLFFFLFPLEENRAAEDSSPSSSTCKEEILEELYENMSPEDILGEGSYGMVVKLKIKGCYFALKVMHTTSKDGTELDEETRQDLHKNFQHEAECLEKFKSDNVSFLILSGLLPKRQIPFLLMDFYDYDLSHFVFYKDEYKEKSKKKWKSFISFYMKSILEALTFVHEQGCFHGDIKPQNILLRYLREDHSYEIVLADFGLCKDRRTPELCYTETYRPPSDFLEEGEFYSKSSDLWAFAKTSLELLLPKDPRKRFDQASYERAVYFSRIPGFSERKEKLESELSFKPPQAVVNTLFLFLDQKEDQRPEASLCLEGFEK